MNLYDGEERADLFRGEKDKVPERMAQLASWMTLRTMSNGEEPGAVSQICTDVVYISDPARRVVIRVRGVVREANLVSARYFLSQNIMISITDGQGDLAFRPAESKCTTAR